MVRVKRYENIPVDVKEIIRYVKGDDCIVESINDLLTSLQGRVKYDVCYDIFPCKVDGEVCDLSFIKVKSKDLARILKGCGKVLLFCASLGLEIDREIFLQGKLSPYKALLLQGIGTERIESLCDTFLFDFQKELGENEGLTTRFSAGYGDLPLSLQTDIIKSLNAERLIGVTLNSSLLMSPSKSVTAFVGIKEGKSEDKTSCDGCNSENCEFRRKQ